MQALSQGLLRHVRTRAQTIRSPGNERHRQTSTHRVRHSFSSSSIVQMDMNRQQSQIEVRSFIERQRADARSKAEAMQRDIIRRINEANQNVLQYMDDRAQMKLSRLADALNTFDNDAVELKTSLSAEQFLPAKRIIDLRTKYASNMFDDRQQQQQQQHEDNADEIDDNRVANMEEQAEWEKSFFANGDKYRMYDELINLRAKWPFLAPALTSIYYATEKDFSLDDIRTFLEYRHDKVLNLFNEHCKAIGRGERMVRSQSDDPCLPHS